MDKKSKVFLLVFFLLIIISVGVTYWRIVIKRDYIIEAQVDCDPMNEKCFIYECDPLIEECTGNPKDDTSYYKLIKRNASNIPLCDPASEDCQALVCPEGEKDCEIMFCSEQTKNPEDVCSDPEIYNLENPIVDESVTIEEAD